MPIGPAVGLEDLVAGWVWRPPAHPVGAQAHGAQLHRAVLVRRAPRSPGL